VILCLIAGSSNTGKHYMNGYQLDFEDSKYPLTLSIILLE